MSHILLMWSHILEKFILLGTLLIFLKDTESRPNSLWFPKKKKKKISWCSLKRTKGRLKQQEVDIKHIAIQSFVCVRAFVSLF